jgi:head-tail adaptor
VIAAGLLRERVTVERPVLVEDDTGGQEDDWQPVVEDWRARVRALGGRDQSTNEALGTIYTYEVTLRLSPSTEGILATDRILWRGLVLKGDGVTIDREAREVRIFCSAGSAVNV